MERLYTTPRDCCMYMYLPTIWLLKPTIKFYWPLMCSIIQRFCVYILIFQLITFVVLCCAFMCCCEWYDAARRLSLYWMHWICLVHRSRSCYVYYEVIISDYKSISKLMPIIIIINGWYCVKTVAFSENYAFASLSHPQRKIVERNWNLNTLIWLVAESANFELICQLDSVSLWTPIFFAGFPQLWGASLTFPHKKVIFARKKAIFAGLYYSFEFLKIQKKMRKFIC